MAKAIDPKNTGIWVAPIIGPGYCLDGAGLYAKRTDFRIRNPRVERRMEKLVNMNLPKMRRELFDDHCHRGSVGEGNWLSLTQFALACRVDAAWLDRRIADGMFPGIEFEAGKWRVFGDMVLRARLARQLESDFGMLPLAQKNNP